MDMEKPQLRFEIVPTNKETEPFRPLLTTRPHGLAPLEPQPIAVNEQSSPQ